MPRRQSVLNNLHKYLRMVKIAVEGIKIPGYHGVYEAERKKGTLFVVDVYMNAEVDMAGQTDDLSHTVDYQSVYDTVVDIMQQPVNLLERLAQHIGKEILSQHKVVNRVLVRVSKIKPLLMEKCERTFVEIDLERS